MGKLYLDWLDDAVAAAAKATGYSWQLFDNDWLYRSRSSGGFDVAPLCVMWHHTAGSDNAWNDARYQCYSASARPISNITVDSKVALVLAGGATNTNGSGDSQKFSRGTVAASDMNRQAVGIEICNNGVGAPYPEKQLDFLFALSNEINRRCGNQPTDVCTHTKYAPGRKIDPSRNTSCQGKWQPGSINSSGSWNVDDLRAECKRRWSGDTGGGSAEGGGARPMPPPTPTEEDEDMVWRVAKRENGAYFIGDGKNALWVSDSGGDIDTAESLLRMAPGAVNVVRTTWDKATDANAGKAMITGWAGIKTTMRDNNLKKYVGATKRF
jgi:hypothetical protein